MRVYEFAKDNGLASKDVLALLEKNGYSVASHMSVLSEQAVQFLQKSFAKKQQVKEVKQPVKESSKPAPIIQSSPDKKKKIAVDKVAAPVKEPGFAQATPGKHPKEVVKKSPVIIKEEKIKPLKETHADLLEEEELSKPPLLVLEEEELNAPEEEQAPTEKIKASPEKKFASEKDVKAAVAKPRRFVSRKERNKFAPIAEKKEITEITLRNDLPLFEVAEMLGKQVGEIILILLKQGMVCNRNQLLSVDTISKLAQSFNITVHRESKKEHTSLTSGIEPSAHKEFVTRWPIVVVMGHVDHGKTTLLDYVRKMNVAAKEKGGITQHLGAYEAQSTHGKIVFLDTPGHQAFSYIRKRGVRVTDIAVLVVAADDGIKPQTVEAIEHAKQAQVPIIVAINKIDKVSNRGVAIETVKRQLAQHQLISEDWGGQIICVPISAKTGEGIEELLEMIILQSQLMELKTDPSVPAQAFILESKLERGYGPVASVICLEGTLKQGDYFTCGSSTGKVRLLINTYGQKVNQAAPGVPVQVVGFDQFVSLGDWLKVVSSADYLKARSSKGTSTTLPNSLTTQAASSATTGEEKATINLIIKSDTQGSREAIKGSINTLLHQRKDIPAQFQIIHSEIGDISGSDVDLAANTGSIIVALHVKAEKNALLYAKEKDVQIQTFQIIYNLVDYLDSHLEVHRKVKVSWKKCGEAVVRKVFDIKNVGVIAGCYIKEGIFTRNCKVVCIRGNQTIGEGKVVSLQRERKVVKEVHGGFECGFITDGFQGWQEDDTVQAFVEVREKQGETTT